MSLANLQVFSQYAYSAMLERITQNIALFNQATRGALVLRGGTNQGDYSDETFYARINGLVRRRDAYGNGAVSAVDINMLLATSVKVAAGTPPVNIDPHWWQWIQRAPTEAGVLIGAQLGEDTIGDMVNTAIKALIAAISNVGATVIHDGTADTLKLTTLNSGQALFGDRTQDLQVWITHSKPMFDLFGTALTNTERLFQFGNVQIRQDGFGRPFIVTDAPDLVYNAGANYHMIGLVPGAAVVERNNDFVDNIETTNGKENIARTYQAQWTYNLGLKGYAWDKTNGGVSPTNAALGTGTNWDKVATDIKDTSGVLVNSQ